MRYTFFICIALITFSVSFAQSEYVAVDNRVYEFLERMETLKIIKEYNSFEIPKTRREIAGYLENVMQSGNLLDENDKKILEDLKVEFEYELFGSFKNSSSLTGHNHDFLSQNQKYLYFYNDPGNMNLFINLLAEGQLLYKNDMILKSSHSAFLGDIGGEIRGTLLDKFGFYIYGIDGRLYGNKDAALSRKDLQYNYKFTETPDEVFFDDTRGYITADFNLIKFMYGRDRMNVGYGMNKILLGNSSPLFDYLTLKIHYKFFSYSFFHGQLLGQETHSNDTITGGVNVVAQKYMAYHRIGFDISSDVNFGFGETIIYGDRPIDLSYLNPFSFYKSVEHSNRDRDNAMIFVDFNNKSVKGLKIYTTFLIDDITFGKLGTGWWGNQTILDAGFDSELLYDLLPLGITFQYTKIDPYVYTHRLIRNNYTNFGYNISSFSSPNSEVFLTGINYRFTNRIELSALFNFKIHGANPLNPDGTVKENVGGDITLGHRLQDSEQVKFLDGYLEYSRYYTFKIIYEPVNDYFITLDVDYSNESLQTVHNKNFDTIFTLSIKI